MDSYEPLIGLRGEWQSAAGSVSAAAAPVAAALDRALAVLVGAGRVTEDTLTMAAGVVCGVVDAPPPEVELLRRRLVEAIHEYAVVAIAGPAPTPAAGSESDEELSAAVLASVGTGIGPGAAPDTAVAAPEPPDAPEPASGRRFTTIPVATRPVIGVALVVVVLAIAGVILVARGHGGGANPVARPSPTPAVTTLHGHFSKTTMTCPGAKETAGDACLIALTLPAGRSHVTVTWPGPALLAMGIRDHAGKDLGPQTTGEKGTDTFETPQIAAGTYELRVVDVTHPATPFDYTLKVITPNT